MAFNCAWASLNLNVPNVVKTEFLFIFKLITAELRITAIELSISLKASRNFYP
ncbi:hypothetical protein [Acinetobacter oleivorans]|uniref:hypothetical protein n=1 Tax=Acinetobacter oleivorans TaxID=1148157 RepID=UPI003A8C4559